MKTRGASASHPSDETDIDKSNPSTPFVDFVRSAFSQLNLKMDNFMASQLAIERKLQSIDARVQINVVDIGQVKQSIEFESERITDIMRDSNTVSEKVDQHDKTVDELTARIGTLEAELNRHERHARSFNARFMGLGETRGENCMQLIDDILRQKFGATENAIENAHRVGKQYGDKPRHVIVRFFSRVTRLDVFRSARDKLTGTGIRIVDDLTTTDMKEKRRVQPYMNALYQQNKRPSFRSGRLCAENQPVPLEQISAFLTSPEGKAATLELATKRR